MKKKVRNKTEVYVVGDSGPEHNTISSIHRTYNGAFVAWDKHRKELQRHAKEILSNSVNSCSSTKEMYERIVKSLSCKDPKKIDNYPHETPYIQEYEVND